MAATMAYLQDHKSSLYSWTRRETAFMTEAHIDMREDWRVVEEAVLKEAAQQRRRG